MRYKNLILALITSLNISSLNAQFRVVTANVNLMPKRLNLVTSGNPGERAVHLAQSLLRQHPDTDVYVLQELYDDQASATLISYLKAHGYDYYPGPNKEQLQDYWNQKNRKVWVAPKNSGQAILVKKTSGLQVESYDVLPFCKYGIEGIGILESYLPKGVVHVKIASPSKGNQSISIFCYHLQAKIGFFALSYFLQGKWSHLPRTLLSDCIHLQPYQKLRSLYPGYTQKVRQRQIEAAVQWIQELERQNKVASQKVHIGDFNLLKGSEEYKALLTKLGVVSASDRTDITATIGNPENTTWSKWLRPVYVALCKYIGSYGWIDLALVNSDLKQKVDDLFMVDLKNEQEKSVTDHQSIAVLLNDVFTNTV